MRDVFFEGAIDDDKFVGVLYVPLTTPPHSMPKAFSITLNQENVLQHRDIVLRRFMSTIGTGWVRISGSRAARPWSWRTKQRQRDILSAARVLHRRSTAGGLSLQWAL
jgi:hypothetical protein